LCGDLPETQRYTNAHSRNRSSGLIEVQKDPKEAPLGTVLKDFAENLNL